MIAEIYGKISGTNINLTERREDELTGNFFGNMRYISFNDGLKKILMQGIYPKELSSSIAKVQNDEWNDNIQFWRKDSQEGEIDVCLEFENLIIGVEVKLDSPLAYEKNLDEKEIDSELLYELSEVEEKTCKDQLNREARMLHKWAGNKEKILLLVADGKYCSKAYKQTIDKGFEKGVTLGYISWQRILQGVKSITLSDPFHKIIKDDLLQLLLKKGFEQFQCFKEEVTINESDLWVFNAKVTKRFGFNIKNCIEGGLYYEFRK